MKRLRIAVGQISSESNHFVPGTCNVDFFRTTGYLHEGEEVFRLADTETEVGGMLRAASKAEIVPLLATRGNSSTVLSDSCWRRLKQGVLRRLEKAGQVDGVVMSHHGSMAVESVDDPEGELAAEIRAIIGRTTPFAMTLDLHGNVTRQMVEATDIICGYETYPHQDARCTGERATRLLLGAIRGDIHPVMAHVKLPMILTGFHGSTFGKGPFAQLMRAARELEGVAPHPSNPPPIELRPVRCTDFSRLRSARTTQIPTKVGTPNGWLRGSILSTSLFLVGSYIDVPDMGCSALVIADGDARHATRCANALAREFWLKRREFVVETVSVAEAVRRGREIKGGPVLLLDTADTTGGGAAGDSIALVRGLIEAGVTEPCLAMVVDPDAARRCHRTRIGETLSLSIGHRVDPQWGKPLKVTGKLVRKSDGRFRYSGGILSGTWSSMGPSAVLQIGSLSLLVMTHPTYDYAYEQYASVGLDPRRAKFVGVKNMMNFRVGYRDIMKGFFVVDCPGPTPTDMRALPFRRVKRPVFPIDDDTHWEAQQ
jgi:microcystin degradation protein MlrC